MKYQNLMQKTYRTPQLIVKLSLGYGLVSEDVMFNSPVDAARAFVRLYADVVVVNEATWYSYLEVVGSQLDRLALLAVVRPRRALEFGQERRCQRDRGGGGQRRQHDRTAAGGRRTCPGCSRIAGQHAGRTCVTPTDTKLPPNVN